MPLLTSFFSTCNSSNSTYKRSSSFSTLKKTESDYTNGTFKNYNTYTVSTTGNTLNNIDEALQFVAIHEGLHYGYVLALLKAIKN